jgi:hypothetical protein
VEVAGSKLFKGFSTPTHITHNSTSHLLSLLYMRTDGKPHAILLSIRDLVTSQTRYHFLLLHQHSIVLSLVPLSGRRNQITQRWVQSLLTIHYSFHILDSGIHT